MGFGLGLGFGLKKHSNAGRIIPNKSDAIVWLDGTISGNNFVDKISGRLFPITNKDFPTGWVKGFPYKSAATFSAPAGDAALIAADLNNFFYTAGVPNQIPVISCFQDVDYEHRLFFRHISQSVNIDTMVETYEPRVAEMVLYNTPATGGDLTARNAYFNVPVEITINVLWVSPTGNNTTGNGSKANPYQTITKGLSNTKITYVKSGVYTEGAYLSIDKAYNVKGIGAVEVKSTGANYVMWFSSAASAIVEGLVLNGESARASVVRYFGNTITHTLTRCVLKGGTTYGIYSDSSSTDQCVVNNCLFINNNTNAIRLTSPFKFYSCFFSGVTSDSSIRAYSINSSGKFTFINSRISVDCSNEYLLSLVNTNQFEVAVTGGRIDGINSGNGIRSYNQKTTEITGVWFSNPETGKTPISIGSNGTLSTKNSINGVSVNTNALNGYGITCGADSTGAGNNKLENIVIDSSRVFGPLYYDNTKSVTIHGIFVGFQSNAIINHNFSLGHSFGVGYKGGVGVDAINGSIKYNVIKDNKNQGIIIGGVTNAPVYNNTLVFKNLNTPSLGAIYIYSIGLSYAFGTKIKNTITVIEQATALSRAVFLVDTDCLTNFECDYNIYYSSLPLLFSVGSNNYTFAQWQALGYDTHSIVLPTLAAAKALFVDYDNMNFALSENSLAIGFGQNLGEPYNVGLDASTNWGSESQLPVVITKQQPVSWDCGAYIH